MISSAREGTLAAHFADFAPGTLAGTTQWVVDDWLATGGVGVNALRRCGCEEGLSDSRCLRPELGRATNGDIVDQSTATDDEYGDDSEQQCSGKRGSSPLYRGRLRRWLLYSWRWSSGWW